MMNDQREDFRNPCRTFERELVAYAAGELEDATRRRVRMHLENCAACRAELAREYDLRRTLGALRVVDTPVGLDDRIRAAVAATGREPASPRRINRLTAVITAAAAILAIILFLPGPRQPADPAWTGPQIAAARKDVMYSLALTIRVLDRTRKDTVVGVFGRQLPHSVHESLRIDKPANPGGNG